MITRHRNHLTFDLHRHYGKKIRYTTCTKPKSIKKRWGLLRLRRLQRPLRMTHKGVSVHVRHNGYCSRWLGQALGPIEP